MNVAKSPRDVEIGAAASVPVIMSPLSHCYVDVPYADPPVDPARAERHACVGVRLYAPQTVAASFDWDPATTLGSRVEAGAGAGLAVGRVEAWIALSVSVLLCCIVAAVLVVVSVGGAPWPPVMLVLALREPA